MSFFGEIVANYSVGRVSVRPSGVAGFGSVRSVVPASQSVSGRAGGRRRYEKLRFWTQSESVSHRHNVTIVGNVHSRPKSDQKINHRFYCLKRNMLTSETYRYAVTTGDPGD